MKNDRRKEDLGSCRCGCGQKATVRKHQLAASCYASCRVWSNVKSPDERRKYLSQLAIRQTRVLMVDHKEIMIGTSPFNWRAPSERMAAPSMRRHRGDVR